LYVEGGGSGASSVVEIQQDSGGTGAALEIDGSGTSDALAVSVGGSGYDFSIDSSGQTILGSSTYKNGVLVFQNSAGSHTAAFSLQADPASSYTLLLPTTGPSISQCLQTDGTTANQLVFAACSTGGSGVTSVAYSTTANANGGSISGSVLTLAKADGTNPGLLSADAQTIGGDKTFTGATIFSPTANNVGTAIKQTSGTATSGNECVHFV